MMLQLRAYSTADIPRLQALADKILAPYPESTLATDLGDTVHDHGQKACVAWRGEIPAGFVGWVDFGVPRDGCCFGAPFIAADIDTATALLDRLVAAARHAGANALRVTVRPPETAKLAAIQAAGFVPVSAFLHLALPLPMTCHFAIPNGLYPVNPSAIDWTELADCFADTFAAVPNAPALPADLLAVEWGKADWSAGRILADAQGRYQAFCMVDEQMIQAIGVRQAWRGHDVASALYQIAAAKLYDDGVAELRSMVASVNRLSLGLHEKLGFTEYKPRWQTYELRW